jgi:hypothetical protein
MSRIALVAALALIVVTAQAADPPAKPDPQAVIAAMIKHGTPGPEHKKLEPLVGSWAHHGKCWMDPSAPPTEFKGTTDRKWVLDGRFVLDETRSEFNGAPFHGVGYTGYDNALKQYKGLWLDNMSTSIMTSSGTADASGKVFTHYSENIDCTTGKPCKGRDVTTIISNDEHTTVMYKIDGGKEIKCMEIHYKRKK